jgi:hypothetical protein
MSDDFDDLFGDDFDDFEDEEIGDDLGDEEDVEFGFEDDEFEDLGDDLDFDDTSDFEFEEDAGEGGPNRTFVYLAGAMIVLFIIGLIAVVILAARPNEGDQRQEETRVAFNATAGAIEATNHAIETALKLTETAGPMIATQEAFDAQATQTAEVLGLTATADAFLAETATAEAALSQTVAALTMTAQGDQLGDLQTQQAQSLTETAIAGATEGPPPTSDPISGNAVALTATAIAQQLRSTPTREEDAVIGTGGAATPPPFVPSGELPDTGLFDDLAGGEGLGVIALLSLGLISLIFGARRLRAMNG